MPRRDQPTPLSAVALHILLALAEDERHGYAIMQEVTAQSEGRYTLGPGTLYDNLSRLLALGFVRDTPRRDAADPRRRYYRLTTTGRCVLVDEIRRWQAQFRRVKPFLTPVREA